jgi:signal transduction histidine kinase
LQGTGTMTLAATVDIERRRISEELHDRIGPDLASVALKLRVIENKLADATDPELLQLLVESQRLLSHSVAEVRELSGELRPARLEYAGLEPALAEYAEQFGRRTGVEMSVSVLVAAPGQRPQRLDAALEWLLFRVVQEALTNCAHHAAAGRVVIDVRREGEFIELRISDDGVGFDPDAIAQGRETPGIGLLEMRERVEDAKGSFSLSSRAGHGTHILATVPITLPPADSHPAD